MCTLIRGINLAEVQAYNAIMAGFNNCVGDFIITIDDDLQHTQFIQIFSKH